MAINRDKILREAEKLVQKGKVEQAIREYEKLLKANPNDANTINRVGDLYGRVGQVEKAVELYERIADHFTQDGFVPKAIAILKKINRLAPQRIDVFEKLAELYIQQGLVVEAKSQYQMLAEYFHKHGDVAKSLNAHRRLAELDPTNHMAQLRLADMLLANGDIDEAIASYSRLGEMLIERGKLDEAERLYRHTMGQDPPTGEYLAPLCEALLDAGRTPAAREFLDLGLAKSPSSHELQLLQVRAKLVFGEAEQALDLARAILTRDPDDHEVRALVGRALLKSGDAIGAREMLLPSAISQLEAGEFAGAQETLQDLVKAMPRDEEVLEAAVRAWRPAGDSDMLFTLKAALADCHYRGDRRAEATRLYSELQASDPDNNLIAERLAALGGAVPVDAEVHEAGHGDSLEAHDVAPGVDDVDIAVIEDDEVEIVIDADLPTFDEAEPEAEVDVQFEAVAAPVPSASPASSGADERLAEANVFAKYGLLDKAIHHLEAVLEASPEHDGARERLAMLLAEQGAHDRAAEVAGPLVGRYRERGDDQALSRIASAIPGLAGAPIADSEPTEVSDDIVLLEIDDSGLGEEPAMFEPPEQAVGEVEGPEPVVFDSPAAYMPAAVGGEGEGTPGPTDEATGDGADDIDPSLVSDLRAALSNADRTAEQAMSELDALEASLRAEASRTGASRPAPAPAGEAELPDAHSVAEPIPSETDELVELSDSFAGPSTGDVQQLDFFIEQELFEDALRLLEDLESKFPEDAELAERRLRLKSKGVLLEEVHSERQPVSEELFADEDEYIDLAAELEEELAAEEAMVAEATGRGKDEALLEEVFREFQKGVAEQLSEEDSDTHFNLGIAYKEMGLLPEAIREFQVASRDQRYFVESCSMIGVCYVEQGMADRAAEWYQKALVAPDLTEDARLALRYDLATALEMAGEHTQAAELYTEIMADNPTYRDVAQRIGGTDRQQQVN
jgi:tetratricopeptide (TPR) repeat protein